MSANNTYYFNTTTVIQRRNTSALMYTQLDTNYKAHQQTDFKTTLESSERKAYSGTVTTQSRLRIKKAVDILLQTTTTKRIYNPVIQKEVDHRLAFITLTISFNDYYISGKVAYIQLLKPFLQWLTKTKGVTKYIWKAERQQAKDHQGNKKNSNGQIHYHLTTDAFIHYDEIKTKWNYLQRINGYLDKYYQSKGHYNPNSTDIHAVYKVNDIESYLIKYVSKEPERLEDEDDAEYYTRTSIGGKVWDCSQSLKGVNYYKVECNEINERKILYNLQKGTLKEIPNDYVGIFKANNFNISNILTGCQLIEYNIWLNNPKQFKIYEEEKSCNYIRYYKTLGVAKTTNVEAANNHAKTIEPKREQIKVQTLFSHIPSQDVPIRSD